MICNNLGLFLGTSIFLLKTIGSRFLSWGLRGTGTPSCVPKNGRVASVYAQVRFFPSFQHWQREGLATVGVETLKNVQGQGDESKRGVLLLSSPESSK